MARRKLIIVAIAVLVIVAGAILLFIAPGDKQAPAKKAIEVNEDLALRVAAKAAPSGYVLGGNSQSGEGSTRDIWIEDMNGDGAKDMAILFIPSSTVRPPEPTSRGPHSLEDVARPRDVSRDILLIVTPLDADGSSEKLAEISQNDFQEAGVMGASFAALRPVAKTIDFNNDGKKEILMPVGYNDADFSFLLGVDYEQEIIDKLTERDKDGVVSAVQIGHAGSGALPFPSQDIFLRDINDDGIEELVAVRLDIQGGASLDFDGPKEIKLLSVYQWNGELFNYSELLSEQLLREFDPERGIPDVITWKN